MSEQQVEQEVPMRTQLKLQALINKITKVENENADYQVELHMANEEKNQLQQQVYQLQQIVSQLHESVATQAEEPDVSEEEPTVLSE